jgi:hypothetical protein
MTIPIYRIEQTLNKNALGDDLTSIYILKSQVNEFDNISSSVSVTITGTLNYNGTFKSKIADVQNEPLYYKILIVKSYTNNVDDLSKSKIVFNLPITSDKEVKTKKASKLYIVAIVCACILLLCLVVYFLYRRSINSDAFDKQEAQKHINYITANSRYKSIRDRRDAKRLL